MGTITGNDGGTPAHNPLLHGTLMIEPDPDFEERQQSSQLRSRLVWICLAILTVAVLGVVGYFAVYLQFYPKH